MTAARDGMWDDGKLDDREIELFESALALPEEERLPWLRKQCEGESALFDAVAALLEREKRLSGFLLSPRHAAAPANCGIQTGRVVAKRFEIRRLIAEGGMSVVFEAFDRVWNESVALKCPKPEFRRRLIAELRNAVKVTHRNVCRLYEFHTVPVESGEVDFLAMEYCPGETLAERLLHGRLDYDEALLIARGICAGVAAAHSMGVFHGDLKPGNVILCSEGGSAVRPVVTDFGLARLHSSVAPGVVGASLRGTPAYVAPERWLGMPTSAASDIYAIGVILYQLFTGRMPGEPGLDWRDARIPRRVRRMVEQCLAPDPEARPGGIGKIEKALAPVRGEAITAGVAAALLLALAVYAGVDRYRTHMVPDVVRLAILPANTDTETAMVGSGVEYDISDRLEPGRNPGKPLVLIPLKAAEEASVNGVEVARKALGATHTLAVRWKQAGSSYVVEGEIRDTESNVVLGSFRQSVRQSNVGDIPAVIAGKLSAALGRRVDLGGGNIRPAGYRDYAEGIHYLREAKDPVRARASFEKALAAGETALLDVRRAEAEILEASGSHSQEALVRARSLLAGLRQSGLNDGPLSKLVASLVDRGDPASGPAVWRDATRAHPEDGEAWRSLGESLRLSGQSPNEAVAAYQKAISIEPGYFEPWVDLGLYSFLKGNYLAARDQFAQAALLAPGLARAHTDLAGALMVLGDLRGAELEFRQALNIVKETRILLGIGAALAYQNRHTESVTYYEQAVALDPDDGNALSNLADAYRRTGKIENAKREYVRLVEGTGRRLTANPSDLMARTFHAYGQARAGNRATALAELGAMIHAAPDNVMVRRTATTAYEALGMRGKALDQIEAAPILISELSRQPDLAGLRSDPRFIKMKADFNLRKAGQQQ